MKQFNLEEYLENPSRKVVTRDGRNVRIICTDRKDPDAPIVALVENEYVEGERGMCYSKEGKVYNDNLSNVDLFFATEKHEGWINIYRTKDDGLFSSNNIWATEEEAKRVKGGAYITTVKIEWDE